MFCGVKQDISNKHTKRANGSGCVYKRNNKYAAYYTISNKAGKQQRKYKYGFNNKKEALEWIAKEKYAPQAKKSKTFSELYELYYNGGMQKLSKDKQTHYRTAWKRLKEIENLQIDKAGIKNLQTVIDSEVCTYYPAKDMKDLLSNLYELAIAEQSCTTNLSSYLVLPELSEKESVALTEDEILLMWEDYEHGHKTTGYYLIMTHSGMMPGEMRKLLPEHIDLKNRIIHGCGIKTKKRKETPLGIAKILIPVINDLLSEVGSNGLFYPYSEDVFYADFKELKKRIGANPKITPYSCRHTFATVLSEREISPETLKEAMRHTQYKTTERYIHKSANNDVIEAVDKF